MVPSLKSNNTPTIRIAFNAKDEEFVLHLISVLGYVSIQRDLDKSAVNIVVRSKEGIKDLILLINGKFRTPKIKRLHNLIDLVNTKWSNSITILLLIIVKIIHLNYL